MPIAFAVSNTISKKNDATFLHLNFYILLLIISDNMMLVKSAFPPERQDRRADDDAPRAAVL